jgi:hypothetical protein
MSEGDRYMLCCRVGLLEFQVTCNIYSKFTVDLTSLASADQYYKTFQGQTCANVGQYETNRSLSLTFRYQFDARISIFVNPRLHKQAMGERAGHWPTVLTRGRFRVD